MLDLKKLREFPEETAQKLSLRGYQMDVEKFKKLDGEFREAGRKEQELRGRRNKLSKAGRPDEGGSSKAVADKKALAQLTENSRRSKEKLDAFLADIPNIPDEAVPEGKDEADNEVLFEKGERKKFDFKPRDHAGLGERYGLSPEQGVLLAGARFSVLHGSLARLHRVLAQFMLEKHISAHGYKEVYVPFIANGKSLFGTGQLPKFKGDLFALEGEDDFYLIPTAEVPLTNLFRGKIFEEKDLMEPIRLIAHTPCFRQEAGSYGRDTRGMLRQHQFDKVELVQITRPEDSAEALQALTGHAEAVLQALGLPWRRVVLCVGDLGFSAKLTYDLEVWLPGQSAYREISSCSNFSDFQARRLKMRFRRADKRMEPVHTLNGSGLAVGRCLVAVMENYQREDGSIVIPEVLRPYFGGAEVLPFN